MTVHTLTFTEQQTLVTLECYKCHILFAMPEDLNRRAHLSSNVNFYCPNGHGQVYTETEVDRLKQQLEEKNKEIALANSARDSFRKAVEREREERLKLERRAANGVCPCCHRTFKQLARHMNSKHRDYIEEHK